MTLNKREIEELEQAPFKKQRLTNSAVWLLQFASKIPWVRRKIDGSIGGLNGRIFRCWDQGNYEEAASIALYALDKYREKNQGLLGFMNHHHWWSFMHHAVQSLESGASGARKEEIVVRALNGIKPFDGFDVAYSFSAFSRWRYAEGHVEDAIKLATTAAEADSTWGDPDFLLGWYALVLGNENATECLTRAVTKDPRILFRVTNDPVCKGRPDICERLKAIAVTGGIMSISNALSEGDAPKAAPSSN